MRYSGVVGLASVVRCFACEVEFDLWFYHDGVRCSLGPFFVRLPRGGLCVWWDALFTTFVLWRFSVVYRVVYSAVVIVVVLFTAWLLGDHFGGRVFYFFVVLSRRCTDWGVSGRSFLGVVVLSRLYFGCREFGDLWVVSRSLGLGPKRGCGLDIFLPLGSNFSCCGGCCRLWCYHGGVTGLCWDVALAGAGGLDGFGRRRCGCG